MTKMIHENHFYATKNLLISDDTIQRVKFCIKCNKRQDEHYL